MHTWIHISYICFYNKTSTIFLQDKNNYLECGSQKMVKIIVQYMCNEIEMLDRFKYKT